MKYCSNCAYNSYDKERREFYCGNKNSENYGVETAYDDHCDEHKEKGLKYKLENVGGKKKW